MKAIFTSVCNRLGFGKKFSINSVGLGNVVDYTVKDEVKAALTAGSNEFDRNYKMHKTIDDLCEVHLIVKDEYPIDEKTKQLIDWIVEEIIKNINKEGESYVHLLPYDYDKDIRADGFGDYNAFLKPGFRDEVDIRFFINPYIIFSGKDFEDRGLWIGDSPVKAMWSSRPIEETYAFLVEHIEKYKQFMANRKIRHLAMLLSSKSITVSDLREAEIGIFKITESPSTDGYRTNVSFYVSMPRSNEEPLEFLLANTNYYQSSSDIPVIPTEVSERAYQYYNGELVDLINRAEEIRLRIINYSIHEGIHLK